MLAPPGYDSLPSKTLLIELGLESLHCNCHALLTSWLYSLSSKNNSKNIHIHKSTHTPIKVPDIFKYN